MSVVNITNMDPLDDLLRSLPDVKLGDGKDNNKKPNDKKKRIPVETSYEGFTIRPISPPVGDKKSWAYCSQTRLPFDSTKLYTMANAHRVRIGKDAVAVYRELTAEQQALVDRLLDVKNALETNDDAFWEPYDIRRVKRDVQKGLFRMDRVLASLEVIIRRKDKHTGTKSDKPTGTTTNPLKVTGDVIDLSVPLDDYLKSVGVGQKKAGKGNKSGNKKEGKANGVDADVDRFLDSLNNPQPQQQSQKIAVPPSAPKQPRNEDPRYFWNGHFWEEKSPEVIAQERAHHEAQQRAHHERMVHEQQRREQLHREQLAREQLAREQQELAMRQQQFQQQQYNARLAQQQQQRQMPPTAPMAPNAAGPQNPFWPQNARQGQFAPMDQGHALYEERRRRSDARSRSRPRSLSRIRYRQRMGDSITSSEEEDFWEDDEYSTPPSSPGPSIGSLHRGKRGYARGYDERGGNRGVDYRLVRVPRRRAVVIDDYPPRRRITATAQGLEDAEFDRPRRARRQSALDILDRNWR